MREYLAECSDLGFDIVEISSGFVSISIDDALRLVDSVREAGLEVTAEVGVQFGAGGASASCELEAEGTREVGDLLARARKFLEAGVRLIMIESEGITENVRDWRTDVVSRVIEELGTEEVMFEAAEPAVFNWYVKTYGPDLNLFVDHSQIVQLEALRRGIWGTSSSGGRVVTYKPEETSQRTR